MRHENSSHVKYYPRGTTAYYFLLFFFAIVFVQKKRGGYQKSKKASFIIKGKEPSIDFVTPMMLFILFI